ncbi:MAG: hypothetical protein IJP92_01135 [Lachnospiraceae bacterium]|nr:hypothetical protein [Lachnospiraceae bacterium]
MVTDRIKRMKERYLWTNDNWTVCTEKARIVTEGFLKYNGWPTIIQRAKAFADYLDQRTIFIQDDELLVGYQSGRPSSCELCCNAGPWRGEEMEKVAKDGLRIPEEDLENMHWIEDNYYHLGSGQDTYEMQSFYHTDSFLFPWRQRGVTNPAWPDKTSGGGNSGTAEGWSMNHVMAIQSPDYSLHLYTGFQKHIDEAKAEMEKIEYRRFADVEKYDFLEATVIAFEAIIRIANRYADLAEKMAKECKDPVRAKELQEMAANCRQVPAGPARTFREGMQAMMFYWCILGTSTISLGRPDKLLGPLYEKDLKEGRITYDEAKELIDMYRLKVAEFYHIWGNAEQRKKWAGMARWNNMVISGCDRDGKDVTNPVSYMILDSIEDLRIPHPTCTVRVGESTPREFLIRAMDVVKKGLGLPAFISEKEYLKYIERHGVDIPVEDAREFCLAGCIDVCLPGVGRHSGVPMFVTEIILELAMNEGVSPVTNFPLGVKVPKFEDFKTYDEFYDAFLKQARRLVDGLSQTNNIRTVVEARKYPDAVLSGFYHNALKIGRDIYSRPSALELQSSLNVVGMSNVINSLAVIKKLVFDDKSISAKDLKAAIDANWEGYEDLRQQCLKVPKYGNNDDYVDSIGVKFWNDLQEIGESFDCVYDEKPMQLSAVSITAHAPAGARCPATPDGRFAGETFADAGTSPTQGTDVNGPLAALASAAKMADKWGTSLYNMKLTPSALKTEEDLGKAADMTKTFLLNGGKHIQYNVVDQETLIDAKEHPEKHKDLIVRVAGYSTFFTILTDPVKEEIIKRTSVEQV